MTDLQEYGKVSDCCGAPVILGDLCSSCYEYCDPLDECDEYDEETNEALYSVTDFNSLNDE